MLDSADKKPIFSDKELDYLLGMLTEPENYDAYDIAEQVKIKAYRYGYEIFRRYDEILTEEEKEVFIRTVKRVEEMLGEKMLQ